MGPDKRETILVVDDEAEVAAALAEYLTQSGYHVHVAPTGHAGLGILRRTKVSLVLVDLRLPDMDGTDLMREALRADRSLDVIIITGHASLQSAIAAVEAGASGYLLKPIDLARLSALVRKLSERRREREVSRMKTDFVAFVTHQLRTPLAGLKWLLELATEDTGLSTETRSQIEDARESAERLIRLVNTLIDISRLETGPLTVTREETDLADVTGAVLRDAEAQIRAKHHRVSVTGAVRPVLADAALLRQAMLSLVTNAVTYTPADGEIEIRLYETPPFVAWSIQDSGVGIPKDSQPRLFEKFYRGENALTMETDGTGLGLYGVRLIIEHLGGRVWCESEEGKGTTVLFTLPGD